MTDPAAAVLPAVLIVDDEVDSCDNLRDILAERGFRVDTANSGEAAVERAAQAHYDIALIDLRMPGIGGLDVFRRIRQSGATTVGIIITAFASHEATLAAAEVGAWRVLSKPVDVRQLTLLIDQALGQSTLP